MGIRTPGSDSLSRASAPALSVVVPARNELASLLQTGKALAAALEPLAIEWEWWVVDDGSTDGTADWLAWQVREDRCLRGICLPVHAGKEAAMAAGIAAAAGDWVVVMDADGQHPPALVRDMWARASRGDVDVVQARRASAEGRHWWARLGLAVLARVPGWPPGLDLRLDTDFKLMRRSVARAVQAATLGRPRFFRAAVAARQAPTASLVFHVPPRAAGRSAWSRLRLAGYALDGVVGWTDGPRWWLGALSLLVAATAGLWLAGARIEAPLLPLVGGVTGLAVAASLVVVSWRWPAWFRSHASPAIPIPDSATRTTPGPGPSPTFTVSSEQPTRSSS